MVVPLMSPATAMPAAFINTRSTPLIAYPMLPDMGWYRPVPGSPEKLRLGAPTLPTISTGLKLPPLLVVQLITSVPSQNSTALVPVGMATAAPPTTGDSTVNVYAPVVALLM